MIFFDNKTLRECTEKGIRIASVFKGSNSNNHKKLEKPGNLTNEFQEKYIFKYYIFCTEKEEIPIIKAMLKFY